MKLMIASDLHGSAFYTKELLRRHGEEAPERLILLGDLLYHGPRNDLPKDYAPKEVIALLNGMKEEIFCVRGNCEAEVDQMVLDFPVLADYMLMYLDGRAVFATHGHTHNLKNLPPLKKGDILLHGHTHIPAMETTEAGITYLNPGSVSIPKADSPHSYICYENGVYSFRDLFTGEEYQRHEVK